MAAYVAPQRLRCWPQTHLPGYVNDFDKLKSAGAEVVTCTAGAGMSSFSLCCKSR